MLLLTLLPLAGWAADAENLSQGWSIKLSNLLETYTGGNLLPTVSLVHDTKPEIKSGFNVVWKNENGEVVTQAVNVGWYEATVTADMTKTYGELANPTMKFWILKTTPKISGGEIMDETAYDTKEHVLLKSTPSTNFGSIEYSIDNKTWSADVPKAKKVGSYTVYARVQESENWNEATASFGPVDITGTKIVAADITAPTVKTGLKFTNADQELINKGAIVKTAAVKELQYKVGTDGEWSTTIPTAKDAKTYDVYYKAVGKDGYYDYVATDPVQVTIAAAAPTLTAPVGATSLTYTGEALDLIGTAATATLGAPVLYQVAFKPVNATDFGSYDPAVKTAKGTAAGTYKIMAVVKEEGNYLAAVSKEIEVTVAQAKAFDTDDDKPKADELIWNNADQQLISAKPVEDGIVDYKLDEGSWGTDIKAMKGSDAGDYKVYYRVNNPNYVGYDEIKTVAGTKIIKKVLSVKVDDIVKTYDGTTNIKPATAPGYTFIGRVENTLNFSGIALSATTKVNVGEYGGELTVAKDALEGVTKNYEYVIIPGKLTIKPVEVTITANTELSIIYGADPNIASEYTHSKLVGTETLADDVFKTLPVLTTNAAAKNPSIGTYTVSFTPGVLKEGGNYVMSTAGEKKDGYVIGTANFVVNPQPDQKIVITVLPQTHTYTGVPEDFSTMEAGVDYYVSGLLDNDELFKAPTFSRSNPGKFNVGTYDLIASGAEISDAIANKYPGGIVYNNSTLTITAKELVATVNTQTVQVGAGVKALNQDAWSVKGLENDEDKSVLKGSLALKDGATAAKNAGIADGIILSITNDNYTLKAGTQFGKLIVIPAGALGLSDDPTNDNFTKIKAFDKNTNVTVQLQLSNRKQSIGGKTFTWDAKQYQILVLPFNVTVSEISSQLGYAVVNVVNETKATADNIYWSLEWDEIPANTPFTVRTAKAIPAEGITLSFTGKEIVAPKTAYPSVDAGNGFKVVGAYEAYTIDESSAKKERFYAGGQHHGIDTGSTNTWTINPFNGYVDLSGSASAPESVTFTFENVDGGTTAIRSINAENAGNAKAEGWYTLNGVKLQGAPVEKGVYIKNGKKIVIK